MDHVMLQQFRVPEEDYLEENATSMHQRTFLKLCQACKVTTGNCQKLFALILPVTCACLRFEHAQRSYVESWGDTAELIKTFHELNEG